MTETTTSAPATDAAVNPGRRLALEAGPLAVFFIANQIWEIMTATALFMVSATIAVVLSIRLERRVPIMPVVSCGFVLLFGGLTLALDDDLFIKIKPTITNLMFAAILMAGLAYRRYFLKLIAGAVFPMTDHGWRILTLRWSVFFVFLAIVNEIVWRNFSTEFWAGFKLFGIFPMTLAFGLAQIPLAMRYQTVDAGAADDQPQSRPETPSAS